MTLLRDDQDRGERVQVECPECDAWVVLAPQPHAKDLGLHALDVTYPGVTAGLVSINVFASTCTCGAQVALTVTRHKSSASVARA